MYKIIIGILITIIIGYIAFRKIESFKLHEDEHEDEYEDEYEDDMQIRKSQYTTMENVYGMDTGYIK